MLIRRLRQSLQREEGQALVLACLMMFVLAVAVLTTVNIGHTVHERVRLQNTADSAAYSMAAMEARAFNFYAFANRTQVSHYVSAMVWQSFDSFLYFMQAFLTDIGGILLTVVPCSKPSGIFWPGACKLIEAIPYIGPVIKVIDNVGKAYIQFLQTVQNAYSSNIIDKAIGNLVNAHRDLNKFLAAASTAVMLSALEHIIGPTNDILAAGTVAENDPNLGTQTLDIPFTLVNACMFDRAHWREANGSPYKPANAFDDDAKDHISAATTSAMAELDKIARAKRVMGAVTDATRFGCDTTSGVGPMSAICPDSFVTSRRLGDLLPKITIFGGNLLGPLKGFLDTLPKWGQTRFQSYEQEFGKDGYNVSPPGSQTPSAGICGIGKGYGKRTGTNRIREWQNTPSYENGEMAQGDNLAADDIYYLGLDINIPGFANPLTCDKDDDWHECWGDPRTKYPDTSNPSNYQGARYMPMKTSVWAISKTEQNAHSINGGVHWRVVLPNDPDAPPSQYPNNNPNQNLGLNEYKKCVGIAVCGACPKIEQVSVYTANVQPVVESWHTWDGIVPFSHFEPGQYADACLPVPLSRSGDPSSTTAADRTRDFNQPSEFVLFHKDPQELRNPNADSTGATTNAPALLNDDGALTWNFGGSSQKLVMEDKSDAFSNDKYGSGPRLGFDSGVTVLARGQTYYHRPGNWAEMPNFFNPYWRPRLASVYQGRNELPLIGPLLNALPAPFQKIEQKILTH